MKYLLIAILIAGVVGCGGSKKEEPLRMTKGDGDTSQPLVPIPEKEDTVIIQEAWYDSGRYYLHTYVMIEDWVVTKYNRPTRKYGAGALEGIGHSYNGGEIKIPYSPYENLIKGKFKYVYEAKSSEYQKAKDYLSSLYALDLKKARIEDSVKMIEDAPTWVWQAVGMFDGKADTLTTSGKGVH